MTGDDMVLVLDLTPLLVFYIAFWVAGEQEGGGDTGRQADRSRDSVCPSLSSTLWCFFVECVKLYGLSHVSRRSCLAGPFILYHGTIFHPVSGAHMFNSQCTYAYV